MTVDLLVVLATAVACAAFGCVLWLAYGRVRSGAARALITVAAALLAYVVYFLVQIVAENLFPALRGVNGHIIAYDVHIFTVALVLVLVAVLLSRRGTGWAEKP